MNKLLTMYFDRSTFDFADYDCRFQIWNVITHSKLFEFARNSPGSLLIIGLVVLAWLIFFYLLPLWSKRKKKHTLAKNIKFAAVGVILYIIILLKMYYEFTYIRYCW